MAPRKKDDKRIFTARLTPAELKALDEAATRDGRTMTEVLRELIRGLDTYRPMPIKPTRDKRRTR